MDSQLILLKYISARVSGFILDPVISPSPKIFCASDVMGALT